MDKSTAAALIPDLISPDEAVRHKALRVLYAGDEATVTVLCDLMAAGMSKPEGCAVIEVLGEIGGFEALMFLLDTFYFDTRSQIKLAAARALQRNTANLNAEERADLEKFFNDLS
jgi:hypothetical protein